MITAKQFMSCSLCGLILMLVIKLGMAHGQTPKTLLLPEPKHIAGIVVDQDGRPIADARIAHSNDRQKEHLTDSAGRFELDSSEPALVVRKAGFHSALLRNQDSKEVRVTLIKSDRTSGFPFCSTANAKSRISVWEGVFQFPKTSSLKEVQEFSDIDYREKVYKLKTQSGTKKIIHGSGPMWSFGEPLNREVWQSIQYTEITYDFDGRIIIDAKGHLPNDRCWRHLGTFGETVSYSDVNCESIDLLDKFIDQACIYLPKRQ